MIVENLFDDAIVEGLAYFPKVAVEKLTGSRVAHDYRLLQRDSALLVS
jgi:hypothetical protein